MKRRRSDPQATRYRIAVAALARAEKRKAAAEKAIRELRAKVRGYERRLPPERRAEIEAGTKAATATAAANRARWKEAEKVLLTAARCAGIAEPNIEELGRVTKGSAGGRKYGLAVELTEGGCLVWDNRRGYMVGAWRYRGSAKRLSRPTEEPPQAFRVQEAA